MEQYPVNNKKDQLPNLVTCGYDALEVLGMSSDPVYMVKQLNDGNHVLKILGASGYGPTNPYEFDIPCRLTHKYIMKYSRLMNVSSCNPKGNNSYKGIGLVMEVADDNIRSFSLRAGTMMNERLTYLYQVLDAVNFMHANNYIHLDIKTDNVLLEIDTLGVKSVKLADFGFSRRIPRNSDRLIINSSYITPKYRPPESYQRNGELYTFSKGSDVWTLGHLIISMLIGGKVYLYDIPPDLYNHVSATQNYLLGAFAVESQRNERITSILTMGGIPQLIPIMKRIFNYNQFQRPSVSEIMSDPIFRQFTLYTDISPKITTLPKKPITDTKALYYVTLILNFLKKTLPNISCKIFFQTVDLFYISLDSVLPNLEENMLHFMYKTVLSVCLWIVLKCNYSYNSISSLYKVINNWIWEDTIYIHSKYESYLEIYEIDLYLYLRGFIDSGFIYDNCFGKEQLKFAHENFLLNPNRYHTFNPSIFIDNDIQQQNGDLSVGDLSITTK